MSIQIFPDPSTEALMRQLEEDERELIEAANACGRWIEEEQRLETRIVALKKAIEALV